MGKSPFCHNHKKGTGLPGITWQQGGSIFSDLGRDPIVHLGYGRSQATSHPEGQGLGVFSGMRDL